MAYDFNKDLMFRNIVFLLSEFGKKIGEFEAETGVSAGYISRASKDDKSKPGIEFVVKAADVLGTDLDSLIRTDYSALTSTERYYLDFINKLKSDTLADKLDWDRESADYLNNLRLDFEDKVHHPLFSVKTFYEQSETEYPEEVTRPVMTSNTFDVHTAIYGNCFNLRLNNESRLYLMSISKSVYRTSDKDAFAKELWMVTKKGAQFLCSNKKSPLASDIDDLYRAVSEASDRPKLDSDVMTVIDSYMAGDSSSIKPNPNKMRLGKVHKKGGGVSAS